MISKENKKIMKILFTINRLHAGSGGAQRVVSLLCNGISDLGHDVLLVLYENRTEYDYYLSEKVKVVVLPNRKKNENTLIAAINKLVVLRQNVSSFEPDVIVPFLSDPTLAIYLATRFSKFSSRIITTVRNNPKIFPKQRKYRWRNNILMALNKACFFQNIEQRDYFPKFIQKKSFVLPNPVSDELMNSVRSETDIYKIITLGRLSEQKNQKMLIKAVALLVPKYKQLSLDIYGDGSLKEELQKMIDSLQMTEHIRLCGLTNDVKSVLLNHGLFVMTSNYEGMPNALIEAMATGMPCISTNCPTGPSDLIIEKDNGMLIAMNNVEECAESIAYMIENRDKALLMGHNARQTIEKELTCSEISKKFLSYCEEFVVNK